MNSKASLLIVSKDASLSYRLRNSPIDDICKLYYCANQENIFSFLKNNNIQIVIMDSEGDECWEFKIVRMIKTFDPMIEIIVVGEPVPSEKVMDWINLGVSDYLLKPLQIETMHLILTRFKILFQEY